MDLIDRLKVLSANIPRIINQLDTEEATKNALIMPFITALGYNVFDPTEVVPEFTADVGVKKGEKVDYAIMREGSPIILIECKSANTNLKKQHSSQLYRYLSVTDARFGVLTNGVDYQVYSDLEAPNKMDERPFLDFSLNDITEDLANQLKKFVKDSFDLESILSTASDLKYTKAIKRIFLEEMTNPSEELVKLLASRVFSGRLTQATKEQFTVFVKRAFHNFVNDRINQRFKSALKAGDTDSINEPEIADENTTDKGVVITTEEELEGYYIVKSIVRETVDAQRVYMRDTQSYCGILLDDNNRRPICRLHFNSSQKYIGILDDERKETRHLIADVNDIYKFAPDLKNAISRYDEAKPAESTEESN